MKLSLFVSKMVGLLLLLELGLSSSSPFFSGMMGLCFEREVDEERAWQGFLRVWCTHVGDQLTYLDCLIHKLELCSTNISVAQSVTQLRVGDDIVIADSIMYLKTIREFEAEKLSNLQMLFAASQNHQCRRRRFASRFSVM